MSRGGVGRSCNCVVSCCIFIVPPTQWPRTCVQTGLSRRSMEPDEGVTGKDKFVGWLSLAVFVGYQTFVFWALYAEIHGHQRPVLSLASWLHELQYCLNIMAIVVPPALYRLGVGRGSTFGDLYLRGRIWTCPGRFPTDTGPNRPRWALEFLLVACVLGLSSTTFYVMVTLRHVRTACLFGLGAGSW